MWLKYRPTVYKTGASAKCSDVWPGRDFCIYGMHNAYGLGNKYQLSGQIFCLTIVKRREKKKDFSLFKDKPIIVQVSHIDL